MVILTLWAWAAAGAVDDVEAVAAELRAARDELALPDSPSAYHLRAVITRGDSVRVVASAGGLVEQAQWPTSGMGVEVRVGDPTFDNTGLSGVWGYLSQGFVYADLPIRGEPAQGGLAARMATWRATDTGFKDAVENYARKQAQVVLPPDHPGDFQVLPAAAADLGDAAIGDLDALTQLALALSQGWAAQPGLDDAVVIIGHEAGERWVIDTDGTRVRRPVEETAVAALIRARAPDGMVLEESRRWIVRSPADLEPRVMAAELSQMTADLLSLRDAATLQEEYVGPVLFEAAAAADLFRYLLGDQLLGTPPPADFETFLGSLPAGQANARLQRRVLPPGWRVTDDPTRLPGHPGGYTWDDEGAPAEAVTLVEDGIVRDLVMSRVPRRGLDGTNGHARSTAGSRAEARLSLTTVTPPRALGEAALHKAALRTAAAYGRDWYLLVRRLRDPAVMMYHTPLYVDASELPLPPPVEVVRVYADGRQERLRGAAFSQVDRYVLRDVIAAGKGAAVDYFAAFELGSYPSDPVSGLAAQIVAPAVVVGEMELVPRPGDPADVAVLAPPGR
jgi:TldD protein